MLHPRIVGSSLLIVISIAILAASSCKSGEDASSSGPIGFGGSVGFGGASSSSSSSASSSSSSGTGGSAPLTCAMDYTTIPPGPCDLLKQDCPIGQSCKPSTNQQKTVWTTACVDNDGLKLRSETCSDTTECEAGLFCVLNVCTPACCPVDDEPCAGGKCNVTISVGENATTHQSMTFFVCSYGVACTLFDPSACPLDPGKGAEFCHVTDLDQGVVTCVPPSPNPVGEGEACDAVNDCGSMQNCLNQKCRYLCSLSTWMTKQPGAGGCPTGQSCSNAITFGLSDIGGCQP